MDSKNENKTLRREDVLAMQAGPEMDALLLERLFTPQQAADIMQKHGTAHLVVYASGKTRSEVRPPKFSTDIAAAMLVAEQFNSYYLNKNAVEGCDASVVRYKPEGSGRARADKMPLAIGRAALLTTVG